MEKLEQYNKLMQDQIDNGILEKVHQRQTDDVINFIPHQAFYPSPSYLKR